MVVSEASCVDRVLSEDINQETGLDIWCAKTTVFRGRSAGFRACA